MYVLPASTVSDVVVSPGGVYVRPAVVPVPPPKRPRLFIRFNKAAESNSAVVPPGGVYVKSVSAVVPVPAVGVGYARSVPSGVYNSCALWSCVK